MKDDENDDGFFEGSLSSCAEQSQTDFDEGFYRSILDRNDTNLDVLRRQAELLASKGDHQAAILLDRRLTQLTPSCCLARYNLACSLSMTDQLDEAIAALECALELGYSDLAHLEADPDLLPLQGHPGFKKLRQQWGLD